MQRNKYGRFVQENGHGVDEYNKIFSGLPPQGKLFVISLVKFSNIKVLGEVLPVPIVAIHVHNQQK